MPALPRSAPVLLCALALVAAGIGPAAADEGESGRFDRVHLRNGRVFEGRIVSEDTCAILLQLASDTGGRGCLRLPREMVARVERGSERPPPRPAGCVRDQWHLLHSGSTVLGARRLVLRHVRSEAETGWRLEETIEHFARGVHIPAVRIQRTERTDLAFRASQLLYREVGEASSDPEGPQRYERILTGPVRDGVWQALMHVGGRAEQRTAPVPPGGRGRLGLREHLLRRRELGVSEVTFLDAESAEPVTARGGYVALGVPDPKGPYDEFVWEEDGARLVSRYRGCEVLEETLAEGVVAIPATPAQVEAAREGEAGGDGEPGVMRIAEIGVRFRLPDATWRFARVEAPPSALGWRKVAVVENRPLVADVRVEWDPEGAAMAPGEGEAAARLLQRLRAWCPDLRVVGPRQRLRLSPEGGDPAWRMDFTGTLRGERVRTVAVVIDRGPGRVLFLTACPEVSWPQASPGIERMVASIQRL